MINKDIGFVLLNISENSYYDNIFKNIKKFIDHNPYQSITIFSSSQNKVETHNVPILHISHAKFFSGDLVLFDIPSIILTENFTNINNRYLYAQDIPWSAEPSINFREWSSIYYQNNLKLIACNSSVYDIYNICWKTPSGIAENFDYDKLYQIIKE